MLTNRSVYRSVYRLMKKISHKPLSVTADEIVDAVEGLPPKSRAVALAALFQLHDRKKRRLNLKVVK